MQKSESNVILSPKTCRKSIAIKGLCSAKVVLEYFISTNQVETTFLVICTTCLFSVSCLARSKKTQMSPSADVSSPDCRGDPITQDLDTIPVGVEFAEVG